VDDATKKAKADKEIGVDELAADIYAAPLSDQVRNITAWQPLQHRRIGAAVNK